MNPTTNMQQPNTEAIVVAAGLRGIGHVLQRRGLVDRAIRAQQAAAASWRAATAHCSHAAGRATLEQQLSLCLFEVAALHSARGEHTMARSLLEEALTIDRALAYDVGCSADWSASAHALGNMLQAQGEREVAQAWWAESHGMTEALLCADPAMGDADVGAAHHALGARLLERGAGPSAVEHFEAALTSDRALHGDAAVRPERAILLEDLGRSLRESYEFEDATECIEAALDVWHALLSPQPSGDAAGPAHNDRQVEHLVAHPRVASCLHVLGLLARDRSDLPRARALLGAALDMSYALYGEGVPRDEVVAILVPLCCVLRELGSVRSACEGHRYALAMCRELHDARAPEPAVAGALRELGATLALLGGTAEYREARGLLEEALGIYTAVYDGAAAEEVSPDVAQTLHGLGGVMLAQGDLPAARTRLDEALDLRRAIYGEDGLNPTIGSTLLLIGRARAIEGDWHGACEYTEAGLAFLKRAHGTDAHRDVREAQRAVLDVRTARDDALDLQAEVASPAAADAVGSSSERLDG